MANPDVTTQLNMSVSVLHQKFIVISDYITRQPIEIFFANGLPNFHSEIFAEAQKVWKEKGKEIVCHGGGRFSIIDNYAVFCSTSNKYHRFENETVEVLAPKHPMFKDKGYTIIVKGGYEDPWQLIEMYKNKEI